jgi:ribose/xylose/arabinose/galactoside ABC-type transport system permease subunit
LIKVNQPKLIGALAVVMFIIFSWIKPAFYSLYSIQNMLNYAGMYGIAALGMTLVILTGGTDLSAGSNMALAGVIGAGLLGNAIGAANPITLPVPVAILIAILASGIIGCVNGFCITYLNIAPFVSTLAMMSIARGLVYVIADAVVQKVSGSPITFINGHFSWLGQGKIGPIPVQFILYFLLFFVLYFVLAHTRFGRSVYAVGGNSTIASLACIQTRNVIISCYSISGVLIGISGIILAGKLSSASTVAATGYELDFITAVALGGTSMAGGKGGVVGTLAGTMFLSVLNCGLDMVNVPSFYQYLIKGIILVMAVYMDLLFQHIKLRD